MNCSSKSILTTLVTALAMSAGIVGCSSSNNGSTSSGGTDAGGGATFTQVYTTILQPTCSSCHSPAGGDKFLDFSSQATAYATLAGAPSGPACGTEGLSSHVVAGNAATSLLYEKVSESKPPCGSQMPLNGSPISEADQELIATWIDDGALNN
jgi:hypothetical protein